MILNTQAEMYLRVYLLILNGFTLIVLCSGADLASTTRREPYYPVPTLLWISVEGGGGRLRLNYSQTCDFKVTSHDERAF